MATGNVSLLDVAKTMPESFKTGVIMHYASTTPVTVALPIETQPTGTKKWNMVVDLAYTGSASAVRNLEGNFTESKTPTQPFSSNFKIYGGRVKTDRLLKDINPTDVKIQEMGQVAASARQLTKDVFEGTGGSYLLGISTAIDNINVYSGQSVDMGTASAGSVLTEDKMDEILDKVNLTESTRIYCTQAVARRLKKLSRGRSSDGYNVNYRPEEFGMFAGVYDDIPIIPLRDGKGDDILSTTDGDGSSSTLYVVTYGPEMFTGFQVKPMEVKDMREIDSVEAFDLEWAVGTAMQHVRCAAKLQYIKNAVS